MGLVSYVNLELECPYCGYLINDYQSKDGILTELNEPWTLNSFYTSCLKCHKWVEYVRKGSEFSNIDLVKEGMRAVEILRLLKKEFDEYCTVVNINPHKLIGKFLKETHYPADSSNWLDWYELRKR